MASIIEIKDLKIGYKNSKQCKVVAHHLSTALNKGEMTCLLGANGKGKSTLMKTICGFLHPISGDIILNGKSIDVLTEKELAKQVAIVLTDKIPVTNASVYELVCYGRSPFTGFLGRLTPNDKKIVKQAIEQCGISHKIHSPLSALSDGERQKATIAKALAQHTPLIILDEPTAFLDLPARVEIMQLLRKLASSGKSILMSTHDLDLALQMADRLWLLHEDHIKTGSPEDLLLTNSFQPMFNNKGIEFDNKTGMFKVCYQHQLTLPVSGHGFEYVLLRRAFARKGVKLIQTTTPQSYWVKIRNNEPSPFLIMENDKVIERINTVEKTVKTALTLLKLTAIYN